MANRRFIDFPIAASVGDNDIVLIWQDGLNKQTTKATLLQGSPQSLAGLTDVDISALNNGQILQYNSTTSKWENVDRTDINLSELGDVTIVAPSNGQVLVYNSSTNKWENSSGGYVPYTGAVTTVNLGAQSILAGSFVKAGGTSAQFLKANGSVDSTAYGTGTVTSVALTMPSAFSVGGSPITTAGTLAVTGAGTVGQYIRGDGSLADFPATTGGGSSVSYYLNGSVSQGTIGGVAYKELNRTPVFGAGTDISINADGYIASFITDALDPNKLLIPGGNWNFETYFSASSSGGSPSFYVELYKYDGTTFTLLATSSSAPELIAFGTNLNPYFSTLAVPETVLALTDRLAVRFYVTHSGRTITLHTENGHLCQVITTFTTGLTALNGLTSQVQFFAVGTSGTDFAISSASDTHTFNLPTASATNRGALTSADWTTFNNKTSNLGTVTSVGLSSATSGVTIGSTPITTSGTITLAIATASGSQNGLLSSTDWTTFNGKQNALTNPVTGTGTSGQVAYFTGTTSISSDSNLFWDATNDKLGIGLTPNSSYGPLQIKSPSSAYTLDLVGRDAGLNSDSQISFWNSFQSSVLASIGNSGSNLYLATGANQPFTLSSGGNFIFGTTTDNGAKLQVSGTAAISSNLTAGGVITSTAGVTMSGGWVRNTLLQSAFPVQVFESNYVGTSRFAAIGYDRTGGMAFWVNSTTIDVTSNSSVFYLANSGTATFSGNVGIVTSTPSAVKPTTTFGWASNLPSRVIEIAPDNSALNGANAGLFLRNNNATTGFDLWADNYFGDSYLDTRYNGAFIFRTNTNATATEQMRITSGGNVLIGTTTDDSKKLRVNGTISSLAQDAYFLSNLGNGTDTKNWSIQNLDTSGQFRIRAGNDAQTDGINAIVISRTGISSVSISISGAATFTSLGTGSVTATSGLLSTVSDSSYKVESGYIDSAIEKVLKLKPRYFYWNEKSGLPKDIRQLGFYAQEVNEALGEEAANTPQDKNTPWGISDRSMIAMLTKAIQEQQEIINDLKQKIK